jgi:hypothetical protein
LFNARKETFDSVDDGTYKTFYKAKNAFLAREVWYGLWFSNVI